MRKRGQEPFLVVGSPFCHGPGQKRFLTPFSRDGFTFIEILATIALLTIVLPSVMTGISLGLGACDLARQEAQAASLAHDKLMEILADSQNQQADLSGDFGETWPAYRWMAQSSDWESGTLRQVDVVVTWQAGGRERFVTLSTLVLDEQIAQAQEEETP
ncbi:MAG: hypothetical protein BWX88_03057 [Planctomycetes bacterium ADurb.Bin126]|nr:MAG: hypothetical protein BWX88_03057 [Planctomycetes bacterium ADurb.Bin126]HOD81788.1 prepilin-type N-terminal cleavage/methylation domain-containing protein [Phycisphaerae bacterium]HQL75568.1 prepilin-type N-terminal cleavage/methylation domain-containing protein [Phycisphaerae bacterium]